VSGAFFKALARDAAQRYPAHDRFARHFAYGKLTGDPVFEFLLARGLIRDSVTLLDVGCGQGLVASLLSAAHQRFGRGDWPAAWPAPARPSAIRGVDLSAKDIERARAAVPSAEWVHGDMAEAPLGEAGTVVILDVLHYVERPLQDKVLHRVAQALESGGTALVRVADANGSLRFRTTLFLDRLMCVVRGQSVTGMHCRPLGEWIGQLRQEGLEAQPIPMSEGTPFANVLLVAKAI
jgi:SAM-dependent methyltransferase